MITFRIATRLTRDFICMRRIFMTVTKFLRVLMTVLGVMQRDGRRRVMAEIARALGRRGIYAGSSPTAPCRTTP
jgi:hypothetical protein